MRKQIVVVESGIRASHMKDFWSKVADGTINGEIFDGFLESPRKFARDRVTLARVVNIFGAGKVLTAEQASRAWNMPVPPSTRIRYTEARLRQCAEENRTRGTDWRLAYATGFSLREQREKVGADKACQPCYYANTWWLDSKEDEWANEKPEAGYYLIDFNGRWGSTSWQKQGEEITKLGPEFERAHEAVVSEFALSFFKVTGERLLETWWHWGRALSSGGYRVVVGHFDADGGDVYHCHPVWDDFSNLRVCLSLKFQS